MDKDDRMEYFKNHLEICFSTFCSHCSHYSNLQVLKVPLCSLPFQLDKVIFILCSVGNMPANTGAFSERRLLKVKDVRFIGSLQGHIGEEASAS